MKKIILLALILFIPVVFASESQIILNHYGFGKAGNEVLFTVHNIGNTTLTNISIFVDSKLYTYFEGKITPKNGLPFSITLAPGDHLIEARADDAYSSVNFTSRTIPLNVEITPEPKESPKGFLSIFSQIVLIVAILTIFSIVFYVVKSRKPKLET